MQRTAAFFSTAILIIILAWVTGGCGGNSRGDTTLPGTQVRPGGECPSAGLATGFTGFADIIGLADTVKAPSEVIRYRCGSDYDKTFPNARLSDYKDQVFKVYTPEGDSAEGLAYGLYSFNLNGVQTALFRETWTVVSVPLAPDAEYEFYLGLLNFEQQCWDWHLLGLDMSVNLTDTAAYQREDGLCLVAVALTGNTPMALHSVSFNAPDLWDEIEPNNFESQAQILPKVPVHAFRGSLGASPQYSTGYDGGNRDYFRISAADDSVLTIAILPTGDAGAGTDYEGISISDKDGCIYHYYLNPRDITYVRGIHYYAARNPYILRLSDDHLCYEIYIVDDTDAEAPCPVLTAEPTSGEAPLSVCFDASESYDPNPGGEIVRYDWDFESDGIWDAVNRAEPTIEHVYQTDGVYYARVRVTNQYGLGNIATRDPVPAGRVTITVGESPYDEVENNDGLTADKCNRLPDLPFSGFTGNVGFYDGFARPVYDGDMMDWFVFHAEGGQKHSFTDDNYDPGALIHDINLAYTIYDLDGDWLKSINNDQRSISFIPSETGDYILCAKIPRTGTVHDYSLRGYLNEPPLIQDVTIEPDCGVGPLTTQITILATDADSDPAELTYRWEETIPNEQVQTGSENTATMSFDSIGYHLVECSVADETGLIDMQKIRVYVWPYEYDEREPNDAIEEANDLPGLPFADFRGSLLGYNDGGYDGLLRDFFLLDTGEQCDFEVTVEYTPPEQLFQVVLMRPDTYEQLVAVLSSDGVVTFRYSEDEPQNHDYLLLMNGNGSPDIYTNIQYSIHINRLPAE